MIVIERQKEMIESVYDDSKSKYIEQLIISSEDTDNDSVTFNDYRKTLIK